MCLENFFTVLDCSTMYKSRLGEPFGGAKTHSGYVDTDPSGRYGRFTEILGKGAMKTVYRAFDEVLGMEVAWNQVSLNNDMFQSPQELQRLYSEVHLLKTLNHESIIRYFASWIDINSRNFNFITEMCTSGTLREYKKRYKRVDMRAVKNWSRQILRGIVYLHGLNPPVIHRDLKCDNIFVNGHLGQVKIGDLGLATVLHGSHHAHSVIGTPEFMAPELYEEEYNELVDVYSFGMCVLEMLTSEYPYSECSNPAQIYKKVTSGKLPKAFYRIEDPEARQFVGKCLETVSKRLPAKELLLDAFLATDETEMMVSMQKVPGQEKSDFGRPEPFLVMDKRSTDMTITGTMNAEDDTIFLKVQISDKEGHVRNVYFPFDIVSDTTLDVATEMVRELEITDYDPYEIAEMIEEEILILVPKWRRECNSLQSHHQHSYNYNEGGDETEHSFYSFPSSPSSSQASLLSFDIFNRTHNSVAFGNDWVQGDVSVLGDTSSQSSSNNCKHSDTDFSLRLENHKCTKFCRGRTTTTEFHDQCITLRDSKRLYGANVSKFGSLMDIRSQLLHRSLVEELQKRRMFNTVGAVENIGFQDP